MIVQKLPYILFRSYSSYGYLTDNRNFGYDTASHSCKKVGELILSNTGKVFYANLKDIPEKLDDVILRLSKLYSAVPVAVISRDALEFYKELHSKGFIFMGAEHDFADFVSHYFSYDNRQAFELNIPQLQLVKQYTKRHLGQNIACLVFILIFRVAVMKDVFIAIYQKRINVL